MHDYFQSYQPITPTPPSVLTDEQVYDWLRNKLFIQPRERQIDRLIASGQPVEAYLLAIENWQQEG